MADTNQRFPFSRSRANREFPFDPFGKGTVIDRQGNKHNGVGDLYDEASYVRQPGVDFQQPWLAVPGSIAFIWPLGMEGLTVDLSPTLAVHKTLGGKNPTVDVLNGGEEHISMEGTFPGSTGASNVRALRNVVNAPTPTGGKILALPDVFAVALRVAVVNFKATRSRDARGAGFDYTLELVTTGAVDSSLDTIAQSDFAQPSASNKGVSANTFVATASQNTLRKIALVLYKDANKWRALYNKNKTLFKKVSMADVPTKKLAPGTKVFY